MKMVALSFLGSFALDLYSRILCAALRHFLGKMLRLPIPEQPDYQNQSWANTTTTTTSAVAIISRAP